MYANALERVIDRHYNTEWGIDMFYLKYQGYGLQYFATTLYAMIHDKNNKEYWDKNNKKYEYCEGYESLEELLDVVIEELDTPKSAREILRELPPEDVEIYY